MARNRPGKEQRKRKAIARDVKLRAQIMTANMREHVEAPKPIPCGPSGFERRAGHSSASRDHLKAGTGTVGFYGGRFYTPKDTVTKRENDGGKLCPLGAPRPIPGANASARFREDDYVTDKPDDKRERRDRKDGKWSRWKKV